MVDGACKISSINQSCARLRHVQIYLDLILSIEIRDAVKTEEKKGKNWFSYKGKEIPTSQCTMLVQPGIANFTLEP